MEQDIRDDEHDEKRHHRIGEEVRARCHARKRDRDTEGNAREEHRAPAAEGHRESQREECSGRVAGRERTVFATFARHDEGRRELFGSTELLRVPGSCAAEVIFEAGVDDKTGAEC